MGSKDVSDTEIDVRNRSRQAGPVSDRAGKGKARLETAAEGLEDRALPSQPSASPEAPIADWAVTAEWNVGQLPPAPVGEPEATARYQAGANRLLAEHYAELQALADALTPVLQDYLTTCKIDTYDDKRALAKWVNAESKRFGLAIRCPKTGRPSALLADPAGRSGRFQLFNDGPDGRKVRTLSSIKLPPLVLVPDAGIPVGGSSSDVRDTNALSIRAYRATRQSRYFETQSDISDLSSPGPLDRKQRLEALLATTPDAGGYTAQSQELEELSHEFRRQVAARLEPALNAQIQAMPRETYEEKKEVARWVNQELRRFDLAIKCPKTGRPSSLCANQGNHPEIGRFSIEHTIDGKKHRPVNSPELMHLELMEASPRREALSEWHARVGRPGGGAKRG